MVHDRFRASEPIRFAGAAQIYHWKDTAAQDKNKIIQMKNKMKPPVKQMQIDN